MRHLALSLMMACALAACGGGGSDGTGGATEATVGTAESSGTASAAASTPNVAAPVAEANSSASTPTSSSGSAQQPVSVANGGGNGASSSVLTGLAAGTYVGHWMGYQATTASIWNFNMGGALLRFTPESYGKLKATGANDVIAKVYQNEIQTVRLGVAITGDLYSDNSIYGQGIGVHMYNTQVSGTYDRAKRRVSLTTYPSGSGAFGVRCKYCDGVYVLPPVINASYSPVGSSSPAGFKVNLSGTKLTWTPMSGVDHWLVSIFEEDGSWVFNLDIGASVATLPFAGHVPAANGDLDYFYSEFMDKLLWPAGAHEIPLPALVSGTRYVAAVTGFNASLGEIAYSSQRWTAR